MKKKLTLIITCVVLVAAIAVGGTLAWFTDSTSVTNVVTFGNVKISLTEPGFDTLTSGDKALDNVQPGDVIAKDPTVKNTGSNPAWIRVKIATTLPEGAPALANVDTIYNIGTKWVKNATDGYYYYDEQLASGAQADVFSQLTIPTDWTNDVSFKDLKVVVTAEAVQAANNGSAYTAANWPTNVHAASSVPVTSGV